MKMIPLTRGMSARVDDADYDRLRPFYWYALRTEYGWYAAYNGPLGNFYMHRLVLNAPDGVQVDHRNGNGLDNQRYNLRLAPDSGNHANRGCQSNNTTGFKGVTWQDRKYWRVQLKCRGVRYHVGYFSTAVDAARAYDAKAIELFGEFARTNAMLGLLDEAKRGATWGTAEPI